MNTTTIELDKKPIGSCWGARFLISSARKSNTSVSRKNYCVLTNARTLRQKRKNSPNCRPC